MKKFLLSILFALLLNGLVPAQNLVPNPGFESPILLPDTIGQLFRAQSWSNLNGGTDWPYATPDYFHVNGTGGTKLPNTYFGDVNPLEGNGCIGLITSNLFQPNFREYASVQLSQPLIPGTPYTISFHITNGTANQYAARGSNNIGLAFTMGSPSQTQREVVPLNPQAEITSVTHHTSWTQYTFSVTPTQPFTHLTIGNFRTDANTTTQVFTGGYALSYYFLDLVNVSPMLPLPADQLALQQVLDPEAVVLEWNIPAVDGEGDWALERSNDREMFTTIAKYEDAGDLLAGQTLQYQDATAQANVEYFYRLRRTDANGAISHSEAIVASFRTEDLYTAGLLFPNPVTTQFSLEFATGESGNFNMELIDLTGQIIHSEEKEIEAGDHILGYELPSAVASGLYHARFTFKGERFVKKVIVQK
jgi:hypothetical protein